MAAQADNEVNSTLITFEQPFEQLSNEISFYLMIYVNFSLMNELCFTHTDIQARAQVLAAKQALQSHLLNDTKDALSSNPALNLTTVESDLDATAFQLGQTQFKNDLEAAEKLLNSATQHLDEKQKELVRKQVISINIYIYYHTS